MYNEYLKPVEVSKKVINIVGVEGNDEYDKLKNLLSSYLPKKDDGGLTFFQCNKCKEYINFNAYYNGKELFLTCKICRDKEKEETSKKIEELKRNDKIKMLYNKLKLLNEHLEKDIGIDDEKIRKKIIKLKEQELLKELADNIQL